MRGQEKSGGEQACWYLKGGSVVLEECLKKHVGLEWESFFVVLGKHRYLTTSNHIYIRHWEYSDLIPILKIVQNRMYLLVKA